MNKQELIARIKRLDEPYLKMELILELIEQLDEPQLIKFKDVIARIKAFDSGSQKVWLDEILNELGSDYGTLKYKAGYEQGKFDGTMEREKVVVPQFVADYIKDAKYYEWDLGDVFDHIANESGESEISKWFYILGNIDVFARAWLDGYKIEQEKRYLVKVKGVYLNSCLIFEKINKKWFFSSAYEIDHQRGSHTRKELEKAGFRGVFDSPLFEVEEVENE